MDHNTIRKGAANLIDVLEQIRDDPAVFRRVLVQQQPVEGGSVMGLAIDAASRGAYTIAPPPPEPCPEWLMEAARHYRVSWGPVRWVAANEDGFVSLYDRRPVRGRDGSWYSDVLGCCMGLSLYLPMHSRDWTRCCWEVTDREENP